MKSLSDKVSFPQISDAGLCLLLLPLQGTLSSLLSQFPGPLISFSAALLHFCSLSLTSMNIIWFLFFFLTACVTFLLFTIKFLSLITNYTVVAAWIRTETLQASPPINCMTLDRALMSSKVSQKNKDNNYTHLTGCVQDKMRQLLKHMHGMEQIISEH